MRRLAQEKDHLEKEVEEQRGAQLHRAEEGSIGSAVAS